MIWVLTGLKEVLIFSQKRFCQNVQLLLKFLQSPVLLLLFPCHTLPVIVDVEVHPVIHHSHHVFFRNKRIIKDLGKARRS